MPKIFEFRGYAVYIWMNENGEPVHVHISKGKPSVNSTKAWITRSGGTLLEHNKSRIPDRDLRAILDIVEKSSDEILDTWSNLFGTVTFYV